MTKHRPTTVPAPEWWKHLRPLNKRLFWSRDRQAGKADVYNEEVESMTMMSPCCFAPVKVAGPGETHYYVCSKCGEPCDPVQREPDRR